MAGIIAGHRICTAAPDLARIWVAAPVVAVPTWADDRAADDRAADMWAVDMGAVAAADITAEPAKRHHNVTRSPDYSGLFAY
jgi:hypothetical protein